MRVFATLPIAFAALLLTSGCAYDYAGGRAPDYSEEYDGGPNAGWGNGAYGQPGDRFGGQNVGNVAVFDAPLAAYGQWVNSRFGRAFRPDVGGDWRPYVNGRWGANRLWISGDPWGWATDHYGRWGFDNRVGWVWTPGTEWGPSWVAWREDDRQNMAGWAPIPPGVNYSINLGFGNGWGFDDFNSWYAPSWVWVPQSFLYQPGFGGRVLPWRLGANYWGGSHWQHQPGWGGRQNWRGNRGRGDQWFGNGQGNWQGDRQGNWQGGQQGNWQDRRGDPRFGNGPGDWQDQRGGFDRRRGGLRPGQSAVPDRDGFVGYRGAPVANSDAPRAGGLGAGGGPGGGAGGGAGGGGRPDRGSPPASVPQYSAPPPQYVERSAPSPLPQPEAPDRVEAPRRSAANDEGPTRPD